MTYEVEMTRNAVKHLRGLNQVTRRRIRNPTNMLSVDPYEGASKLTVRPGFRVRVGDYRILFDVDEGRQAVIVTGILHRREAYR